ncbi:two-component response regulator-like PRR1 [Capsella rubella]|uniref:two-component response regulator-like PRR1 n=1 Tax=Capsella rubella TaxID=81985 RepID=UPI000CD5265F|nr:two-component response regulator-like PRR1 [Capsella rubella]
MLGFKDDITSPLSAQIFDFCDPQLFQETFNQTSEVTSSSNVLEKSGSFQSNTNTTTTTENSNNNKSIRLQDDEDDNNNNTDLSIIFDSQEDFENDITASIDFSSSSLQYPVIDQLLTATSQDQFDFSSGLQVIHQPPPNNISFSEDPLSLPAVSSLAPPPLQSGGFEEDCLSSVPSYNLGLNTSYSFFRNSGLPAYMSTGLFSAENNLGFLPGNIQVGSEINKPHDQFMDFQADNGGLFCPDSIKRIFNPEDLQALGVGGVENQSHLMTPQANPAIGPVEINGLEDPTLSKVGKLSPEQRKEKIRRYMKKRNERNFNKKIKYACRKTLADSRPRVRGRFAKNDDFGEPNRQASSSHHDDEDEDDIMGVVKDEEQLVDSSDIFAHISGANSFKCNYPIQSWI